MRRFFALAVCLLLAVLSTVSLSGCLLTLPEIPNTGIEEEELTPPVENEPTPPVENEPTPPAEEEPTPPVENEPAPPVENEPTPPVEDEPTPPVENEPTPPEENEPTPPVENEPTPPEENEPTPPVENEPTPPVEDEPTPPVEDEIIASLVHISARPEFVFNNDVTNTLAGEASPIQNDYYLSAFKVTNEQYAVFIRETGRKAPSYWKNGTFPAGKEDHPVLSVSYSDAVSYCEWLSEKYDDWTFRLPTEAEWENAAYGSFYGNRDVKYPSGGSSPSYNALTGHLDTTFNFNGVIAAKLFRDYGSDYVVNYVKGDFAGDSETLGECISISKNGGVTNWANHGGNATKGYFLQTDLYALVSADGGYTTPVGSFAPNSLGLYDMAGNCWDITSSVIVANNGLEKGIECYAVRGGSWYATARSCTLYYRGEGRKDFPSSTVGFRIAADYTPADLSE